MSKPTKPALERAAGTDEKIEMLYDYVETLRREFEFRLGLLSGEERAPQRREGTEE